MKNIKYFLVAALLVCSAVIPAKAHESGRTFPPPSKGSPEIQKLIAAPPFMEQRPDASAPVGAAAGTDEQLRKPMQ